ncbi:MAG: hypothetical protein Q8M03_00350 [Legionella sp.]|nr:hypothetical protein [Legionella sp.]
MITVVTRKYLKSREKEIDLLKCRAHLSDREKSSLDLLISKYNAKVFYYNAYQNGELYTNKYYPKDLETHKQLHKVHQRMLNVPQPPSPDFFSKGSSAGFTLLSAKIEQADYVSEPEECDSETNESDEYYIPEPANVL